MAPSREIEKLERRWQENPLGLTFAPLAEAYRKEGRFPDAIELLNIGLTQHPNYVPAHIVRGRCFLDTQADRAAMAAFVRVIEIDGENVIALKALADIAERAGRFEEARTRLERLLEFDRNNDEAREQLARVVAALRMPRPGEVDLSKPLVEVVPDEAPAAILQETANPVVRAPGHDPVPASVPVPVPAPVPAPIELGPVSQPQEAGPPSAADYAGVFGAASGTPGSQPPSPASPSPEPPAADRQETAGRAPDGVDTTAGGDGPASAATADFHEPPAAHQGPPPADDASSAEDPFEQADDTLEIEVTPELDVASAVPSGAPSAAPSPDEPEEPEESEEPEPFAAVIDAADDRLEVVAFNPVELSAVEGTEYQLHDDAATLRPDEARGRGHLVDDVAPLPVAPESGPAEPAAATAAEIETAAAEDTEPAAAEATSPDPVAERQGGPDGAVEEPAAEATDAASVSGLPVPDDVPAEVEEVFDAEPDAELVITESMAELFLNQGHRELALAVYTQLLTREPDNPRLIAAIDELRPSTGPAPAQGLPAYAAVLTGGQSVRSFFEQLLSARRPEPGRRAPDVSLGSVFGEGGGTGYPDPDVADAGPTFDEFFAGDDAAPPPPTPGPESDEDAGAEDLENFTTWLKGLKR